MVVRQHTPPPDQIAAIDLGSNSFHMVIARVVDDELQVVDRIKDMVRLAAGLGDDNTLEVQAQARALAALELFGERVQGMPRGTVRAVGTNTLRKATNNKGFLKQAQKALGHPIDIISGSEEARLIYLGVSHTIGTGDGRRLVVDIGGGSTELIIGEEFEPIVRESKYMGCVSYSKRFFSDGKLTKKAFDKAMLATQQELRTSAKRYRDLGWKIAVGSSGTIKAIFSMIVEGGIDKMITPSALKTLRNRMLEKHDVAKLLELPGLSERRVPVIAGGLAILMGVFKSLNVQEMIVSDGALREGALFDLLGRIHNHDIRDETIRNLAVHNQVDEEHALRIERTAMRLLEQVKDAWEISREEDEQMLAWAAAIHEIGLSISHSRYHKHGSYLVENSDLPGFSREDQKVLWAMIRSHRRRFKIHRFSDLHGDFARTGPRLTVLLRLAVLLNRARTEDAVPEDLKLKAKRDGKRLKLRFPKGWLDSSPLTRADLAEEARFLAPVFDLKYK